MANKSKAGKAVRMVLFVVIFLLLVAALGIVFHFTNGGKEDFKTFYLVHNGKTITASKSNMLLDPKEDQCFETKYLVGTSKGERNYTVSIVANEDADFKFIVDGAAHMWSDLGDITECFDLKKEAGAFTLLNLSDLSLERVLSTLFPLGEIVFIGETDLVSSFFYKLIVTSCDGKVSYEIAFSVFIEMEDFNIDNSHFVF